MTFEKFENTKIWRNDRTKQGCAPTYEVRKALQKEKKCYLILILDNKIIDTAILSGIDIVCCPVPIMCNN